MAAVLLETTELETLFEAAVTNPSVGIQVLSAFRVKNSGAPAAIPANYGPQDLTRPHDSAWRAALAGVQADLNA